MFTLRMQMDILDHYGKHGRDSAEYLSLSQTQNAKCDEQL